MVCVCVSNERDFWGEASQPPACVSEFHPHRIEVLLQKFVLLSQDTKSKVCLVPPTGKMKKETDVPAVFLRHVLLRIRGNPASPSLFLIAVAHGIKRRYEQKKSWKIF